MWVKIKLLIRIKTTKNMKYALIHYITLHYNVVALLDGTNHNTYDVK